MTDVSIGEVESRIHTVDQGALLSPATLHKVVAVVLAALDDRQAHQERVRAEQRITPGVASEQRNPEG